MLCRLCIVDDKNIQILEDAVCDMLRAVLRKKCIPLKNPVICTNCIKKVEKAFEFKTTCLRTQKILSLYGGSTTKVVYIKDNKLCVSPKSETSLKLCRTCLRVIENGFGKNLLTIVDKLAVYIPEMVISDRETSLFCYKCLDQFKVFSELINLVNNAESLIMNYCKENKITNFEQNSLDDLFNKKVKDESNIMKLVSSNHLLLDLENEFESTYLHDSMDDSKKRIIKKIIEEDADMFYKDIPDFDVHESFPDECKIDSDYSNILYGEQKQLVLSDSEEELSWKKIGKNVEEDESTMRLSFETEDSSLSPGTLSDRLFYESESQDEEKKEDREATSPNPFIFFDGRNEQKCSCSDTGEAVQSRTKRKWCEKCKLKKNVEIGETVRDVTVKRPKKDGGKKCRKMYGIEFKDMWCTRCKWKKACSRFGNTKAVNRR
ncbi:unnamed protein product [Phyllotreta striolata]|uniref:ZAD domain-containing protein n=1 Tax=Phyllotreta striolata TaxID=444603 RepID=A0A9N9XNZ3_PHYSR|nr:unnamed protein product [Phyllotreta striolata]